MLVDSIGYGLIIPLIPFYALAFGATPTLLGVMVASFALMQFFFAPILGRFSDKVGRRPVLSLSLLISTVSFIIFTIANSFIMLLFSRIIAGMATEYGVAYAYVSDISDEQRRASVLGKIGAASNIGIIVGPAVGGFMNIYGRFWAPGLAAIILNLLNLLSVYLFLPETISAGNKDTVKERSGTPFIKKITAFLISPVTGPALGILFVMSFAFSAMPVVLPLFSWDVFGLGEAEVGFFFTYIGIIGLLVQLLLVGRLSRRIGDAAVAILGILLTITGIFSIPVFLDLTVFMLAITVVSIGLFLVDVAVPSFLSKKTNPEYYGGIMGVSESMGSIARVPGPFIAGFAYQLALIAPFMVAGLMLIGALGLGIVTSKRSDRKMDS